MQIHSTVADRLGFLVAHPVGRGILVETLTARKIHEIDFRFGSLIGDRMVPGQTDRIDHMTAGRGTVLRLGVDLSVLVCGLENRSQFFGGDSLSFNLAVYFGRSRRRDTDIREMRVRLGHEKISEAT